MVVPDVNLLIYAYNVAAPFHAPARKWWEGLLRSDVPVGVPWAVAFGFIRLATHARVLQDPLAPEEALDRVDAWFRVPSVRPIEPGPRHLAIVRDLFAATGLAGSLTTDTHLAALAIEHRAELLSNDSDFRRFPGLRLRNPLEV